MANNIKGITIEINGETKGLQSALKDVNKEARNISAELREVEKGLKLDPSNVTLLAQKQQLLAKSVESAKEKLKTLQSAQAQVEQQFARGDIGEEQYRAFQREVVNTESRLNGLQSQLGETEQAQRSEEQEVKSNTKETKNWKGAIDLSAEAIEKL